MNIYDAFAVFMFSILFIRVYLSYKMDRLRGTEPVFLKFIFGAYAFAGMFPVLRIPRSSKESKLKKLSNILFVVFWLLFATLMAIIWISYHFHYEG
jgi:hypothetical protein